MTIQIGKENVYTFDSEKGTVTKSNHNNAELITESIRTYAGMSLFKEAIQEEFGKYGVYSPDTAFAVSRIERSMGIENEFIMFYEADQDRIAKNDIAVKFVDPEDRTIKEELFRTKEQASLFISKSGIIDDVMSVEEKYRMPADKDDLYFVVGKFDDYSADYKYFAYTDEMEARRTLFKDRLDDVLFAISRTPELGRFADLSKITGVSEERYIIKYEAFVQGISLLDNDIDGVIEAIDNCDKEVEIEQEDPADIEV